MDPIVIEQPLKRKYSQDQEGHRKWTRAWWVTVDRYDGPQEATAACPFLLWAAYEGADGFVDPGAKCIGQDTECVSVTESAGNSVSLYEVTANYGFLPSDDPSDPFSEPAQIKGGANKEQEIVDFDWEGTAILNAAGDPYDPPVMRDSSGGAVTTFTQAEPTYNGNLAAEYRNTVNAGPFLGADAGTVKCEAIDIDGPHYRGDVEYYNYSYSFSWNRDGWKKRILNRGMRELNDDGDAVNILDADGQPITEPMCLDEDGHKLPPDGTPVENEYTVYEEKDFSVFSLRV